jgi:hypothetical protein
LRRRGAGVLALALGLGLALPAGAEVRAVEAVGAVPLDAAAPPVTPPRDAALHKALTDAVWRVALDELPDFDAPTQEEALAAALGDEPLDFATRFRILEDRGERPALFSEDPEVEKEYVVVAEVHVDTERVRERLAGAGLLLVPSGEGRRVRVRVVIEDVESYASYMAVRTLLEELGVRSALPLEMQPGRVVLDVDGHRTPEELLGDLLRAAPSNLSLEPLGSDAESLRLRARFLGATEPAPAEVWPGAPAIDTTEANRY